jgi:hypothetical protein
MAVNNTSKRHFFIDNVKIFSIRRYKELKNALPLDLLKIHSYKLKFKPKTNCTTLNISCPDNYCLSLLLKHESDLGKYYISSLLSQR